MLQTLKVAENFQEPSNLFVCALGIGTVFIGLICLVLLCKIVGILSRNETNPAQQTTIAPAPAPVVAKSELIENRQEIIAAVSAAIAEELGTDISAIRILSFKKN